MSVQILSMASAAKISHELDTFFFPLSSTVSCYILNFPVTSIVLARLRIKEDAALAYGVRDLVLAGRNFSVSGGLWCKREQGLGMLSGVTWAVTKGVHVGFTHLKP